MFQGNWTCSKCGGAITQLPFEPKGNSGLTCRECYFKEKDGGSAGSGVAPTDSSNNAEANMGASGDIDDRDVPPFDPDESGSASEPAPEDPEMSSAPVVAPAGERPKFTGDWKCAGCGASITSLPFQPRDTSGLKCIDCFKASKA